MMATGPVGLWRSIAVGVLVLIVTLSRAPADDLRVGQRTDQSDQVAEYQADGPKTILQLQQFRRAMSVATHGPAGRAVEATLVDVNPNIHAWFLLTLEGPDAGARATYHLENPRPREQTLSLTEGTRGILISSGGQDVACDLWAPGSPILEEARRSSLPYAPLCGGRLFLRNRVGASATELERLTDFLRDHVWSGEKIISFVKKQFFRDAFLEEGAPAAEAVPTPRGRAAGEGPMAAAVGGPYGGSCMLPEHLAIGVASNAQELALGCWYAVAGVPGVYVSLIAPRAIASDVLDSYRGTVNRLDAVESRALAYLVGFDLAELEVGFALGTVHPRVGWSDRIRAGVRKSLPGPDGIDTAAPLVTNGMVSPALSPRLVATFTGGFKRQHGAFRSGALAARNSGSHYGFVEQGAVFSKLVPGLATLYVLDDGSLGMKTWTPYDDALLPRIRHSRQNGVALLEHDPMSGESRPGPLVAQWGAGNWSGSPDENLRTLRAGACLQETPSGRFLVYGYFSSATPSAMARVFQAYRCRYAMHLDMNALEHTYLALYARKDEEIAIQHLIDGMAVVDRTSRGRLVPRFLGAPDDRDFFYVYRRERSR